MKKYLLLILIIGFTGCTSKEEYILFNQATKKQNNTKIQKETLEQLSNVQFEYKIRPYDRISIIVYKHPDISTSSPETLQQERGLLVNSKGDVRLPLIKKIHLQGLTQTDAEDTLEEAYSVYIKHPDIQVEVLNKKAYVIGEVKRPGEVALVNEQLSLLQILATAGDLTDSANRQSILIISEGTGDKPLTRVVNLTDVNSLRTSNLMVKPNDIVYVTPNNMKAFNTGVNEIDPIFNLIGHVLAPFVNIKFLSQ